MTAEAPTCKALNGKVSLVRVLSGTWGGIRVARRPRHLRSAYRRRDPVVKMDPTGILTTFELFGPDHMQHMMPSGQRPMELGHMREMLRQQ